MEGDAGVRSGRHQDVVEQVRVVEEDERAIKVLDRTACAKAVRIPAAFREDLNSRLLNEVAVEEGQGLQRKRQPHAPSSKEATKECSRSLPRETCHRSAGSSKGRCSFAPAGRSQQSREPRQHQR